MALRYLIASGNVADPTKWDGGVSVPGSGDDCYANGFTGTISADFTVNSLNTTASGPAAAGGGFTCSTAVTITAPGGFRAGTTNCLTISALGTAVGPSFGSLTTGSRSGLVLSSFATQTGDSTGGAFSASHGTSLSVCATQYGNSYAGSVFNAYGSSVITAAVQVGDSFGGSSTNCRGTFLNAGTHIGQSNGGSAAGSYGTQAQGNGQHYGACVGGSNATAYGTAVASGGVAIPTSITNSTGPGLSIANDGVIILQGTATLGQVDITALAGRYRIDRGASSVRPFIRPPVHPAFVS